MRNHGKRIKEMPPRQSKSDYGSQYQYTGGRPHAVSAVTVGSQTVTFGYDGAGNQTTRSQGGTVSRQVRYDVHNRPVWLRGSGSTAPQAQTGDVDFRYGPDGGRYLQRVKNGNGTMDRVVVYPFEGLELEGSIHAAATQMSYQRARQRLGDYGWWLVGLGVGGQRVWQHEDRLGSAVAKTGSDGQVLVSAQGYPERHGYDAYGRPRTQTWEPGGPPLAPGRRGNV